MRNKYLSFHELVESLDSSSILYNDLLKTVEWQKRRESIVGRDNNKCTRCGKGPTIRHFRDHLWIEAEEWIESGYQKDLGALFEPKGLKMIASDKPYYLHVHHKYYIVNRLPWEYDDEALTTLCNWCHWELHENEEIEIFLDDGITKTEFTPCSRCNGAGWFPEYSHVEEGICFKCRGSMYEELLIKIK
ncbi:MAG: hypothetical protein KI791_09275 [Cyclobacteriaceae bacterium]|nr:hypothetical protein [Cyclobacteriaceae bacterium SS2]|tara:strand:- start:273 stop:839 length:567 start_codon:yes stop_codon:yes gene_type:complete